MDQNINLHVVFYMQNSLRKNISFNIFNQIFNLLVPLITIPYISRILGVTGVGEYSFSFAIVSIAITISALGGDAHGNASIAATRDTYEKSKTFWGIFSIQVFATVLATVLYFMYIMYTEEYSILLLLQSIHLLASLFNINWFFYGEKKFDLMTIRNVIIKSLSLVCIFIFVKTANDVYIYIIILAISSLLSSLSVWPILLKNIKLVKLEINDITKHIRPMLLLFLTVLAISLYKKMDKVMIGWFSNIAENGYYENADKIIRIPITIINAIGLVLIPHISSSLLKKQNHERNVLKIKKILFMCMILSVAFTFGIITIAKYFVPMFFGPTFSKSIILLIIMSPTIIFVSYSSLLRSAYLIPKNLSKFYVVSTLSGAIINLIINSFLIPPYGALGAAIGTLVAEFVVMFVQFMYVRSEFKFTEIIKNTFPFIIIGLVMFGIVSIIDNYLLYNLSYLNIVLINIIIGAILYISISLLYLIFIKHKFSSVKSFKNYINL